MRLQTLAAVFGFLSILLPALASGQQGADVERFRDALLTYAYGLPEAADAGSNLVEQILELDREALATWLSRVPDPERYVILLESLAAEVTEPARDTEEEDLAGGRGGGIGDFEPFPPDYPPNSGRYGGYLLTELEPCPGFLQGGSKLRHHVQNLLGVTRLCETPRVEGEVAQLVQHFQCAVCPGQYRTNF